MKQKFHITHLSSSNFLVQKVLNHIASFTNDNKIFPSGGLKEIVENYKNGLYHYRLIQVENRYALLEDGELVLSMELIEVHELT